MNVYQLADSQREALLAGDKVVAGRLIAAYTTLDNDLQARLKALTDLIQARRASGDEVNEQWLRREARYEALLTQIERETVRLAQFTANETRTEVHNNLQSGVRDALALVRATVPEATSLGAAFNRLPKAAIQNISAYLHQDAPLSKLLDRVTKEMPTEARERAEKVLLIGVGTGQAPLVIAHNLRESTGLSLNRSLTIARTEGLRAYRQASLQTYTDNDAVTGWEWLSTKSARTCPACLAMDGKVFEKTAPFPAHVRCRCTSVPVVLGQTGERQTGEAWLEAQDHDVQDTIMGKSAAGAWRNGEVRLSDFVGVRENAEWGASIYHNSIKGARERAKARHS